MSLLNKLRIRLTVINAVVSGVVLLAMALGALLFTRSYFVTGNDNAFAHAADSVAYYVQSEALVRHSYLSQIELSQELLIHIEDGGSPFQWPGVLKSQTPRDILLQRAWSEAGQNGVDVSKRAYSTKNYVGKIRGDAGEEYHFSIWLLPGENSWHSITIMRDMHNEQRTLLSLTFIVLGCAVLGLIALGLFSYSFAGRAIRPVEEAQRQQSQFVQAASHELRTPAAVMQASAGALLKARGEDAERFALAIEQQSRHLAGLVEDLLLLASSDTGTLGMNFAPVEPEKVLQGAAEDFSLLLEEKGIRFLREVKPLPPVWGDALRLRQVLHILLDNALEHTPSGGKILLKAVRNGQQLEISVADTGPGVPEEHKAHIFERFYRADKARSRDKAHYGLGLSIAAEIMRLHGGKIAVADNNGGGAVFTLRLPVEGAKG